MAFWQRRRLYRHEKELVVHKAKEEANPYPWSHPDDDEEAGLCDRSVWNGGQAALRKETAVCETVLSMLEMLAHEPDTTPLVEEAKQLEDQAEPVRAKVRELFSQYRPALEQGNAERERAAAISEGVREKFAAYQRQG